MGCRFMTSGTFLSMLPEECRKVVQFVEVLPNGSVNVFLKDGYRFASSGGDSFSFSPEIDWHNGIACYSSVLDKFELVCDGNERFVFPDGLKR